MTPDPVFLDIEDVLEFHDELIDRHGGETGIRSPALLESAMAQPRASFSGEYLHKDLFLMAAAYAFHIAQNQPFLDGNKRTGLLAGLTFLDLNSLPIDAPSNRLYDAMLDIAEGRLDKTGLADLFRELVRS